MTIAIILIIILIFWLTPIRSWLGRLMANFMAHRTEDFIRKATGMPPRPGSRQARKEARRQNASGPCDERTGSTGRGYRRRASENHTGGPIIPKEYAEDVEFVETIDYSETIIAASDEKGNTAVYHESQVTDVEWEEIKVKNK